VRVLLGIDDDDDLEKLANKARAKLTELGVSHTPHLPAVLELLDVASGDIAWARLDPMQRRRRIEQSVHSLLCAYCSGGPSILLFEDLHWCDEDSLAFISKLIAAPPVSHTFMLLTHRPGLQLAAAGAAHVLHCEIPGLDTSDAHALLANLLGSHTSSTALRSRLATRTVGNPFFIEESVRSVIDAGLERTAPGFRDPDAIDLPESIDALLGARVDRLPETLLDVLQAAAVIGDDASIELLRAVVELGEAEFASCLDSLTHSDLLYETLQPTVAHDAPALFRFKHALIQEVVYKRLGRARKRSLHGRVVDALEALFPERLSEHVVRLAEHAQRAERWEKCAYDHPRACIRAASYSSNAQAITHLDRGLEALSRLSPGPEHDRLAIDLRLTALAPLLPAGAHERVISLLSEAEQYARGLDDRRRLAKISSQLSTELWLTARYEAARCQAENALQLAQDLKSDRFALEVGARYNMATIHHACGEFQEALAILRELAVLFTGETARRRMGWAGYPSVMTRVFIISVQSMLGGFDEAARAFEEGRAFADELDHPFSRTLILEQYGMCLIVRGEAERAAELLQEAIEIGERDEVRTMDTPILSHLGMALLQLGKIDEAALVIERAASGPAGLEGHYALHYLALARSQLELQRGQLKHAQQLAEAALEDARKHGERGFAVRALLQYAHAVAADAELRDTAVLAYTDALTHAQQLGMQPSAAVALTGLAEVLVRQGRVAEARESLLAAQGLWEALRAPVRVSELRALLVRARLER
jgi:predicted ATPase